MTYTQEIADATPRMIALRCDIHANPEVEFQESRTAAIIVERLNAVGFKVEEGIGHTGVVGVLEGGSGGPTLMIRADIDALPMPERTGLAFASTVDAMHACGHDSHVAIAVTAAELLARHASELHGTVIFAFQPAEENNVGAQAMSDDGFFDRYKADRVIALHIGASGAVGEVSAAAGPTMAGKDTFKLTITGRVEATARCRTSPSITW
jgi:hippurate hydrolase